MLDKGLLASVHLVHRVTTDEHTMSNLQSILEVVMFVLAAGFSVFATTEAAPLGLSLFTASALLVCFAGSCWSIFKALTK